MAVLAGRVPKFAALGLLDAAGVARDGIGYPHAAAAWPAPLPSRAGRGGKQGAAGRDGPASVACGRRGILPDHWPFTRALCIYSFWALVHTMR